MSDERLKAELQQAVEELRTPVAVRSDWREALHARLHDEPLPAVFPRHTVRMAPWQAIAAALMCMVAGGAATAWLLPQVRAPGVAAASTQVATTLAAHSPQNEIAVHFSVVAPGATRVSLVGDFNGWQADAAPLELSADGRTWTTALALPAGRHTYAFLIDGDVVADPVAPRAPDDDFGVPSSVLLVGTLQ